MTTKKAAKLAVIVGHNNRAQGAFSASPLNMTEYVFNKSIALDMETMSTPEMEIEVFFRKAGLGYRKEIAEVYSRVDKWIGKSKGATIELHFNSFNGSSIGTETLSSGTVESLAFAEEVQEELLSVLARRKKADRGVKIRGSKERGGASLHSSIHPSILVEPFFGDVVSEALLASKTGIATFAEAYVVAARAFIGATHSVPSLKLADAA